MSQSCSKLVVQIENLKTAKLRLNELIGEFLRLDQKTEGTIKDKNTILLNIYKLRKEITDSLLLKDFGRRIRIINEEADLTTDDLMFIVNYFAAMTAGNISLTKNELICLYNLNTDYEEFNYSIRQVKRKRNKKADLAIVFGCLPEEIICNKKELHTALNKKMRIVAYVGELSYDLFDLLPIGMEHVYEKELYNKQAYFR